LIRSFRPGLTEAIWNGATPKGFPPDLLKRARAKLAMLHAAANLSDLLVPPGNRLENLRGSRAGQHSIRLNDQWHICFGWTDGGANAVEIVDYH
jgi:toxin HigB-1